MDYCQGLWPRLFGPHARFLVFRQRLLQGPTIGLTFPLLSGTEEPFQGLPDRSRCRKSSRTLSSLDPLLRFASWV